MTGRIATRLAGALAASVLLAVPAMAQFKKAEDAIQYRQSAFTVMANHMGRLAAMAKGEAPFDAAKANEAMGTIATSWAAFAKLFPKGSETGGETTASPKIWESFKDFEDKGAKLASDATAAQKAAANGADAFKTAFGDVTKNCGGCHKPYRIQK